MNFLIKHIYDFKILLIKYGKLLITYYLKCLLFVLNFIVRNTLVYLIYILLVIYSFFSCLVGIDCNSIHPIILMLVSHLQLSSVELYFLCKVPITRNWLIKLLGDKYFLVNLPKGSKFVLKYCLPVLLLFFLEVVTTVVIGDLTISASEACYVRYQELYGFDGLIWDDNIKQQYLSEQSAILKSTADHGVVYFIGRQIDSIFNYIGTIITKFV